MGEDEAVPLGPPTARTLYLGLVALLLGSLLPASLPTPARAAEPAPTALTLSAPAQYADRSVTLTVRLTSGETPVAGASVVIDRREGDLWQPVATVVTGLDGTATAQLVVSRSVPRNDVRASYAGDATYAPSVRIYRLPLLAHPTTTSISGPTSVVDEQSVVLQLTRRTTDGRPVAGPVLLQRYADGRWRTVATLATNAEGWVRARVAPRVDSRWRAVGRRLAWAAAAVSRVHRIDNLPPGVPVRLPAAAPRPRIALPAQNRATGRGANPVVRRIPDRVWRHMTGRSWHRGCPVGRSGLRLLRINYWDYTGYRRRGELVAAAGAIHQMAGALRAMYAARLPIRSMYRVDRFGWSDRLQGADDYRSMAAGNTSAFNCRWVVGRPGIRSPHAYGRSLDVNPWENPYRSSHGWVPNAWWPSRAHERVAWRSRSHRVVRIMADHGLRWTYGHGDLHHFDAATRTGRPLVVPGCEDAVCH